MRLATWASVLEYLSTQLLSRVPSSRSGYRYTVVSGTPSSRSGTLLQVQLLQLLLLPLLLLQQLLLLPLLLLLLLLPSHVEAILQHGIGMWTICIRNRNRIPASRVFKAIQFGGEQSGARTEAAGL